MLRNSNHKPNSYQHYPTFIFEYFIEFSSRGSPVSEEDANNFMVLKPNLTPTEQHTIIGEDEVLGGRFKVLKIDYREICTIYICKDQNTLETVVLKTLRDEFLSSERLESLFKDEALIAISLDENPYIVHALHFKYIDSRPFLILEYIFPDKYGRNTLDQYLQDNISLELVLKWADQFCEGMIYMAENSIKAHRDIKPENLMITTDLNLKITDFSLANIETETESYICGSPPWMAPEQFRGEADVRSDVYSFGIVLYQMMNNGRPPFHAEDEDPDVEIRKWYLAHKNQNPQSLKTLLFPVIKKCLAKNPQDRYQNFNDLKTDLLNFKEIKSEYKH